MSSLDSTFTIQPSELFPTNTLSNASALALLPKITTLLAHEIAAWATYCASVQTKTKRFTTQITQAHARGAHVDTIRAIALYHLSTTLPARFAVLAGLKRCEALDLLSETLVGLRGAVERDGVGGSVAGFGGYYRRVVYDWGFAEAVEEQEVVLTELGNARMEQLRRMRRVLLVGGGGQAAVSGTRDVVVFVEGMEEMGIDVQGIVAGESVEGT